MRRIPLLLIFLLLPTLVLGADTTPVATPQSVPEPMAAGNVLKMLLGLVVVVALMFVLAWFMRRVGALPGMGSGQLKVVGGLSLGSRERIVLVQAGETQLLVGVSPGRVQTLHVLDENISMVGPQGQKGDFASNLKAALKRQDS